VTLNVCLGRAGFQASELTFCGRAGAPDHRASVRCKHTHTIGTGVLHLGRHRHGADEITSGERCNLIVWARSSAFRAAAAFGHIEPDGYPRMPESAPPAEACLSAANDSDYDSQLARLSKT
jgi:hypothetical protein